MSELFSTFGINWKLILIQGVNFLLLLFVLKHFLFDKVFAVLDERKRVIEKGIADAAEAERKNKEATEEGRVIVATAAKDADGIIARTKMRSEEISAQLLSEAQARSEQIAKDAQLRAEEAKERALRESREEIAKAAVLVAEKILTGSTSHITSKRSTK
jgi:F-type H+-transporting ATPase subunit b